jgi:hypothetical protein
MNFNNRADRNLSDMVASGSLSGAGACWLKAATNPFFDTADRVQLGNSSFSYEGMPNMKTEPSVNRTIQQQVNISSSFGTTVTYDVMIVTWPQLNSQQFEICGRSNNIVNVRPIGAAFTVPHLAVYTKPSTTPNFIYQAQPDFMIEIPPQYCTGVFSLNFGGFEVVNTTPDLYRGGSLSCVRYSQPAREPTAWQIAPPSAGHALTVATVQQIRAPPVNLSELNNFPNAVTWSARDGCYCVYSLNNLEDMPQYPSYTQPVINPRLFDDVPYSDATLNTADCSFPHITDTTNPAYMAFIPCFANVELDTNVVMMTGLSPQSTFTLTSRVGIESFPTSAEPEILVLAKPSASYDACALALYTETIRNLPPGVPAGLNPSGEWWDSVMDTVVGSAEALGTMFAPELTPLIQAAGGAYNAYRKSSAPKKRQVQKKQQIVKKAEQKAVKKLAAESRAATIPAEFKVDPNYWNIDSYDPQRKGAVKGARRPPGNNRRKKPAARGRRRK